MAIKPPLDAREYVKASSAISIQEWSLESFLQHHPAKFNGKCSPGEANHWFRDMERIYEAKRCPDENKLTYTHYSRPSFTLNISLTIDKEIEFLQLVQGNMTIVEYADRFKHLLRFYTMAIEKEWQCRKFENGLRGDIKLLLKGLRIQKFPTLVEMARVMEKTKKEVEG
ncbi:uncharacterized protein LOC106779318 [Vigna radiata var. radiata]|uniref:Uncharacterized protein LOC106779318 n=1 Tax=Vigna radiata var. radiata TaxID=3916 RepID=A0A1S3VWZ8_VIGRR|nr:uncharacterized protein LOC106779318 [Vigna radiata var. radiata]